MNVLPESMKSRWGAAARTRVGGLVVAAVLIVVSSGWIVGTASAAPLPLGFPLNPVINSTTGLPVCDPGDESPNYADIRCNVVDTASAYFGSNGTVLAASFVLEGDPRVTAGGQEPFHSTTYVVELGVNGVHVANIGIDGKGTGDSDYLYAACLGSVNLHPVNLTLALAAGTVTVVADGAFWRLTFNVPIADLAPCITPAMTLAPYFGTSQAGPLDNINKDFFLGAGVNFGPVTPPSMTITKTDSPDPVAPGNSITYTLTATNTAAVPIAAFKITDTVTAPLTFVSAATTSTGLTCNNVAAVVCNFSGSLATSGTVVVTIVAGVPAGFAGASVSNSTTVGSPTGTVYDTATATTAVSTISVPAASPTVSQSTCVGGAPSVPSYTIVPSAGIGYSVGGVTVTGTNNVTAGTTVVVTATATAVGSAASPPTFTLVFGAAPTCTVAATAPTVSQSTCVGGVASVPSYTIVPSAGIVYSVGGVTVTGTNNVTAGTTVVVTATATGAGLVGVPSTFTLVFGAAPTCTVAATAPTLSQSTCVGGVASVPSYTIVPTAGIVYSVGGVTVTGTNNVTAGSTVTVTATATGAGLVGVPPTFTLVFTAAPTCTVTAAAPSVDQSVCLFGAPSVPSYTIVPTAGIVYSVGGVPVTGSNPATAGTTVVVTATATGAGLVAVPPTFSLVFNAAPTGCTVNAAAPTVTQSACVGGAASTPTYTIVPTAGIVYSVGGVTVTGTNNATAGTTVVVTATATTAGHAAAPPTFSLVFNAAPTGCTVNAAAPTTTQSACVGGVASTPTYTIVPTAGIVYSVGGVTVTGTNNATAGTTVVVTATAIAAGHAPSQATFTLTFAAAPNCFVPTPPAPPVVDLGISKTGPAIARPGDTVTYVLTVTSLGGPATGFTVTDQVPADLSLVSMSGTGFVCTVTSATCSFAGTLGSGNTVVVTVVANVAAGFTGTSLANTAVVSPTDATPANNSSTYTTPIAQPEPQDLGISKTGPGTAHPGDELVYSIDVTNVKGTPASGFTVTDVVPVGLAISAATGNGFGCSIAGQTISCTYGGTLAVGQSASIAVRALLDPAFKGTSIANTAVVDPGRGDVDTANNTSTATTTVVPVATPLAGGDGGAAGAPPAAPPVAGGTAAPASKPALPFTGTYADEMLKLGASLLVFGLVLSLIARRRREATE